MEAKVRKIPPTLAPIRETSERNFGQLDLVPTLKKIKRARRSQVDSTWDPYPNAHITPTSYVYIPDEGARCVTVVALEPVHC